MQKTLRQLSLDIYNIGNKNMLTYLFTMWFQGIHYKITAIMWEETSMNAYFLKYTEYFLKIIHIIYFVTLEKLLKALIYMS